MGDENMENGNDQVVKSDAPVEEANTAQMPSAMTEAPKVKNRKKYIIGAVIALLVVMIAVVIVVLLNNQHDDQTTEVNDNLSADVEDEKSGSKDDTTKDDNAQNELTPDEQVEATVERIKAKIAVNELVISEYNYAPEYRAEGMKAFTRLDKGIGISVTVANKQDKNTEAYLMSDNFTNLVIGELTDAGFEGYYNMDDALVWGEGSYLNSQTGVVCQMMSRMMPFMLWCGHTSWLSEETKTMVNELAEAIEVADRNLELNEMTAIVVKGDTLEDSKYKPYQRMQAGLSSHNGIGGAVGLFYRTSPEAKWQFFAGTQGPMDCAEYDTEDLRKAYMGEMCWDVETMGEGVVEVE